MIPYVNRFLLAFAILSMGACHIISGGDEIVVEDDDSGKGSGGAGNGNCSSDWDCDNVTDCYCADNGFPCLNPDTNAALNCEKQCEVCL